jgi:hypothetical protein
VGSIPIARSTHLYDRNRRLRGVVVDAVIPRSPTPAIEAALRRLLVGLERPVHLDEWRRREERREQPKAA